MSYLTAILIGIIGGLLLGVLLPAYSGRKRELLIDSKLIDTSSLATKEDMRKITSEIERLKHIQKHNFDLLNAEREFYSENKIE